MEQLELLMGGFASALTPINLLWVLIGALLGTAVGVLPGLGSAMAVALLLPVTFSLEPTAAFIMFAGIYFGGLFGDSTSGILLNTPGHSSAIASTFEGHRMAKSGQAAKALATCAIGAFIGGLIATTLVVFFAPTLVKMATVFGPAEYFALAVFAFLAISAVVSESVIRGIAALGIGLALALVGIDGPSGTARFTLGMPQLFDGISVIVITVGLLALGEVFHIASRIHRDPMATRIETKGRATAEPRRLQEGPARPGSAAPPSAPRSGSSPPAARKCPPSWPTAPKNNWPSDGTIRNSAPPAPSTASQPPKPPPTPPPAPPWVHCSHWDCPHRQPQRSCSQHSSNTACSQAPCSSNEAVTWSGPCWPHCSSAWSSW